MKYLIKALPILFIVALQCVFYFGEYTEMKKRHDKSDDCVKKEQEVFTKNEKIDYKFYNIDSKKWTLGYNHVAAFLAYQHEQCMMGNKIFGE